MGFTRITGTNVKKKPTKHSRSVANKTPAINKRVPQLIRRVRTRVSQAIPIPRRRHVIDLVDPIINVPDHEQPAELSSRKRRIYPLPRRTPPQPAAAGDAHAQDVNGRQADVAPGLDGCRVINDDETWPTSPSPISAEGTSTTRQNPDSLLEEGLSQWNALSVPLQNDEELYGEALEMRNGKHREKLKRDVSSFPSFFSALLFFTD
jgi:hypothetical protein